MRDVVVTGATSAGRRHRRDLLPPVAVQPYRPSRRRGDATPFRHDHRALGALQYSSTTRFRPISSPRRQGGDVANDVWMPCARQWLCSVAIAMRFHNARARAGRSSTFRRVRQRLPLAATPRARCDEFARPARSPRLRPRWPRCNTVQPGTSSRGARRRFPPPEGGATRRLDHTPPTAIDVAYAVLFFASHESECISGVTLQVDAGSSAGRGRTFDYPPAD